MTTKEKQMIDAIYPGCVDLIGHEFGNVELLQHMGLRCFIDGKTGPAVDSLRRCLKAIGECNPYRNTPEYEALIDLDPFDPCPEAGGTDQSCKDTGCVCQRGKIELDFVLAFKRVQRGVHETAVSKGWWDVARSSGELIALMHSELSEALEAMRNRNPPDDKLPEFSGAEAELADVIIRIMDAAEMWGWKVAEALVAKAEYNKGRPHKHGKDF